MEVGWNSAVAQETELEGSLDSSVREANALIITGTAKVRLPPSRRRQRELTEYRFRCAVSDERWAVDLEQLNPEAFIQRDPTVGESVLTTAPAIENVVSDGEQFFVVQRCTNYTVVNAETASTGHDAPNDLAAMGQGSVPFGMISDTALAIWYSYCSSTYLRSRTESAIVPLHSTALLSPRDVPREVPARWSYAESSQLPGFIVTSNDFAGEREYQQQYLDRMNSVPHTNVIFQVMATTNVSSIVLPANIRVIHWLHLFNNDGTHEVRARKEIEISLEAVELNKPWRFGTPEITRKTFVYDQRLWFSNPPSPVSLTVTNGWPADAAFRSSYVERVAFENRNRREQSVVKSVWVILLAVVLCAPLFLLWKRVRSADRR